MGKNLAADKTGYRAKLLEKKKQEKEQLKQAKNKNGNSSMIDLPILNHSQVKTLADALSRIPGLAKKSNNSTSKKAQVLKPPPILNSISNILEKNGNSNSLLLKK